MELMELLFSQNTIEHHGNISSPWNVLECCGKRRLLFLLFKMCVGSRLGYVVASISAAPFGLFA
jgi:hypothetical protein